MGDDETAMHALTQGIQSDEVKNVSVLLDALIQPLHGQTRTRPFCAD